MSRRKVLLGVSGSWILTLTRVGSGLVAMPLYFHYVEAKMLGAWMLFVSMSGFFMVTDLGIAMVFSRELAFKSGERAQTGAAGVQAAADLYASVSRIYWIMGAAVFFIGGALGWAYLGGLDLGEGLSQARQAWLIYALGTCFVLAGSTPNYALQGLGDLGVEALANSLATVLGLAATFAALHRGGGVLAMALIFSAQALGTRLVLTQLLRRRHAWLFEVQGAYVAGTLKKILKTTLPLFITRMGALFVFQINPLLIAWILGAAALPDYVVLVTLASYGTQLCLALPQSLAPFVAAKQAAGDREGIRRLLMLCVKSGMALQLAYTVSVGLWAGALMQLWLGPGHFLGYGVLGFWLGWATSTSEPSAVSPI
ncbi:MAG: oligosaccharide flippase family protein, partial [candidate division FCPU426 bacterium]